MFSVLVSMVFDVMFLMGWEAYVLRQNLQEKSWQFLSSKIGVDLARSETWTSNTSVMTDHVINSRWQTCLNLSATESKLSFEKWLVMHLMSHFQKDFLFFFVVAYTCLLWKQNLTLPKIVFIAQNVCTKYWFKISVSSQVRISTPKHRPKL